MFMPAEVLHCPACGAAVSSTAVHCDYCGATLATVACPSCFAMMFVGSKFCSHCGAIVARTEAAGSEQRLCPRCQMDMKTVTLGNSTLRECPKCAGLWVDPETLRQICTEHDKQSATLDIAVPHTGTPDQLAKIRYVPCPVCHKLMNRVNFGRCSSVIVDVCKAHGTWFDADKLRQTVEFIRAGGLEKARAHQIAELKEQQERLAVQQQAGVTAFTITTQDWSRQNTSDVISDILHLLIDS